MLKDIEEFSLRMGYFWGEGLGAERALPHDLRVLEINKIPYGLYITIRHNSFYVPVPKKII